MKIDICITLLEQIARSDPEFVVIQNLEEEFYPGNDGSLLIL